MKTVTTINLNGRAYQVEEMGHALLAAYLEKAEAALAENPDKDEIIADFEQALAEKFHKYLTPNKNVISTKEIETIIAEMGPVDGSGKTDAEKEAAGSTESSDSKEGQPRRLYRIKEGAVIAGVCNGLAIFFNVDVTLIRVGFVAVTLISHGFGIAAYFIMMMVLPKADTSEAQAHAAGSMPFNAHEFIEQAKKNYAEYKDDKHHWKRRWKDESKYWKYKAKQEAHMYKRQQKHENAWAEAFIGILWVCIIIGLCIVAYRHVPFFHYNFDRLGHWITLKTNRIS